MIEFLEGAEAELLKAVLWYEEGEVGLGDRLLAAVEKTSETLIEWPYSGSLWTHSEVPVGVRRIPLKTFPYQLVYVTEPRLVIVAVAHMKRQPDYWRERLRQI